MSNEILPIEGHQLPALEMGAVAVPAIVMSAGERGAYRFLEFFAANIRNLNTRSAYYRNVCAFLPGANAGMSGSLPRSGLIMWPATSRC